MIYVSLTEKACVNIFEACVEKIDWNLEKFSMNIMFLYNKVLDSTLRELGEFLLEEFKKHRDHEDVVLTFCGTDVRGITIIALHFGEMVICRSFVVIVEDDRTKDVCLSNHGHPADLTMLIR